ncbi:hypothetical protein F2Q69_00030318 [Brassica cretica]|uniref:Uncharacterized protein n=1 Tax=Brassica cretica TaxID=69181 RepID=A0A8S9RUL8_BRACR|nr:hypothetical protein F2Q69_00030318 [Brassica cretica]
MTDLLENVFLSHKIRERNSQYGRQEEREDLGHKLLPAPTAGSNMVWREKRNSQISPQRSPPPDALHTLMSIEHEHTSEEPKSLERNLANYDFPPLPHIPTTKEVMQELVDVSIQYTNSEDPVKREARR